MRRRDFLRQSAAAAAASVSFPYFVPATVFGQATRPAANDRIRIGFIGVGGRAQWIMTNEDLSQADIIAVADCDLPRCDEAAKKVPGGEKWKKYQDYRAMLDKEKLDAVFVETTTHARVLICIDALAAGLDVYGEKPLTLTVAEGRSLVKAAAKYKRVFQTGTQQRSMPINAWASKLIREGGIGKVTEVITCNYEGPKAWEKKPPQPIPDGLDWDKWCHQTDLVPYHPEIQRQWALFRAYDGGGQSWGVTGWGTHGLDQVQCALGTDDTGPIQIWPEEKGPHSKVTMRYFNGTVLKLHGAKRQYEDLGAIFVGEKGRIEIQRGKLVADPPELIKDAPPEMKVLGPKESTDHINDFFDCMRTRKRTNADAEVGHRSTTLCHLVNICREVGRPLRWDPNREEFAGDEEANALLSRPRRKGYEIPKEFA